MTASDARTAKNKNQAKRPFIASRQLQLLSILFGLFVSGYLSYLKLTDVPSVCIQSGPFNCDVVLNSIYSELGGIPIAWLGFSTYVLLGAIIVSEARIQFLRQYGKLLAFGVGLFAWLFSMWLVFVQFALLQALCPWCLSHEVNFTVLFALICYRLYQEIAAEG